MLSRQALSRNPLKFKINLTKVVAYPHIQTRSNHILKFSSTTNKHLKHCRKHVLFAGVQIRHESSTSAQTVLGSEPVLEPIPEPPAPPVEISDITQSAVEIQTFINEFNRSTGSILKSSIIRGESIDSTTTPYSSRPEIYRTAMEVFSRPQSTESLTTEYVEKTVHGSKEAVGQTSEIIPEIYKTADKIWTSGSSHPETSHHLNSSAIDQGEVISPIPQLSQGAESVYSSVDGLGQTSNAGSESKSIFDFLPEPPHVPSEINTPFIETLAGEPTFASIGLGSWWPSGLVQYSMEFLHVTCDLPWWASAVIGYYAISLSTLVVTGICHYCRYVIKIYDRNTTVPELIKFRYKDEDKVYTYNRTLVIRLCLFPFVVLSQRNTARLNNNLPTVQNYQMKLTELRQRGDNLAVARISAEMAKFMSEKNLNPFKSMIPALVQAPIFISVFFGLREMATLPVESLKTGGLYWFVDLTVPDQFYILPVMTSATFYITMKLGYQSTQTSQNMMLMKYVLNAMPVIMIPFIVNFPGLMLVYWTTTNFVTLAQVGVLKIPQVRTFFNIEKTITHQPSNLAIKDKGFLNNIKESWTNLKITNELQQREFADKSAFINAGREPIRKTYKYYPEKLIQAKKNSS